MITFIASALALLAVLVLAYFVIKGGAKLAGIKKGNGALQLIESTAIGSRERLIVVRYRDKEMLLGVTAQNVTVINQNVVNDDLTASSTTTLVDEH